MDVNAKVHHLIKGCLRNKKEHQKNLYQVLYGFAHGIALRYAGSREDAVVIMNKGFYYAFTRLREYKEISGFKEWLRDLMVQATIEHYYNITHHSDVPSEPVINEENYSCSTDLERTLSYGNYIKMLHQLPDACRIVFNLFVIDGYGHERIAMFLDISVGKSESLLTNARRQLRRLMDAE